MWRAINTVWAGQRGSITVEYALLLLLVVAGGIGAWDELSATCQLALDIVLDSVR